MYETCGQSTGTDQVCGTKDIIEIMAEGHTDNDPPLEIVYEGDEEATEFATCKWTLQRDKEEAISLD